MKNASLRFSCLSTFAPSLIAPHPFLFSLPSASLLKVVYVYYLVSLYWLMDGRFEDAEETRPIVQERREEPEPAANTADPERGHVQDTPGYQQQYIVE